jgi:hypothetical protein
MMAFRWSDCSTGHEKEWREVLVEIQCARRAYVDYLAHANAEQTQLAYLWLRLWRAERRRDVLLASAE